MIDETFLRQTAALQANLKMLESQQDALSDFQDMQALRQYKARLLDYIEAHVAKGTLQPDPYGVIADRLGEIARFFEEVEKESDLLLNGKKDWLKKIPHVGLADLHQARADLDHMVQKLPEIRERLAAMIHPSDWDESKSDLHTELLVCASTLGDISLPKSETKRVEIFQFAHGHGNLSLRVSKYLSDLRARIGDLEQLHARHGEQLQVAEQHLALQNFRTAARILKELEQNFTDIPYIPANQALENLMAKHREFKDLNKCLDQHFQDNGWKKLPSEFNRLRLNIATPESELGSECHALLVEMEKRLSSFRKARKSNLIRTTLITTALAAPLVMVFLWGNHQAAKLQQAEAQTAAIAQSIRAEALAKAERERTEALAKAERERAEALAKAEHERTEALAKLLTEIYTGAIGKTLDIPLPGGSLLRMAYCPAGSFKMGSPATEGGRGSDENQVQAHISKAFWLGKTEITQAQWRAVMGENPSSFKGDDQPVERVSWEDTQEFIKKVNAAGILPTGWKLALPGEAQWEYACRAGETGTYSGGTIDQVAWYEDNSDDKTHPVATKAPNTWGLHDMHGNVWEWCADWYKEELLGGADPSGTSSGDFRVVRGGSWGSTAADCRAALRFRYYPDYRYFSLGFRPALVPSE
jgi:formylglycine-generating enzyme required for sulfatase activity